MFQEILKNDSKGLHQMTIDKNGRGKYACRVSWQRIDLINVITNRHSLTKQDGNIR